MMERTDPAAARALTRRFPAALALPRIGFATLPSPVAQIQGENLGDSLWIKRDDLNAPELGGNKVRILEYLLAPVRPGDSVLTVGGEGSTHVLATAWYGGRIGAKVDAIRWPHEMTPDARLVAARAEDLCASVTLRRSPVTGMLDALARRLRGGTHWIPLGGSSPAGVLGHVCAGLELAEQVARGECPPPARVVVPLGSGGTAAGLLLGMAIAGLPGTLIAARAGPRTGVDHWRIRHLAEGGRRLLQRLTGERIPSVDGSRLTVVHNVYGGAYGRPLDRAEAARQSLERRLAITLDSTYSAKAFVAALEAASGSGPTLFWSTFDGRWMRPMARE